jgi:hypothetical protein
MGWPLAISLFIFAGMLALRISAWRANPVQSSWKNRAKLARVLIIAALAMLAIVMRLSRLGDAIDGKPKSDPNFVERILDHF